MVQFINIIKKFSSLLTKRQKVKVFILFVLMFIGGIFEMLSVSLFMPFMNMVMNPEQTMEKWYVAWFCDLLGIESSKIFLVVLSFVLAFLYVFKNLFLLWEYNLQYRFSFRSMFAMQSKLLKLFLNRSYETYLNINSAEIIRIINNDTSAVFSLLISLLGLFTELIVAIILTATIFIMTPFITTCMAVILLLLVVIINVFLKPRSYNNGLSNQKSYAGMNKWLLQSINGIKDLVVLKKEDFFEENFEKYGLQYIESLRKSRIYSVIPRFTIEAVTMSSMFVVIGFLIYRGQDLAMMISILTVVAMAAMRLLPSINRISAGLAQISYSEPMLDVVIDNLKYGEENTKIRKSLSKRAGADEKVEHFNESINLSGITYHYPNREDNVLLEASMKINKGDSVGIVGPSGAGKTTTVDILLGLLKPQEGKVTVDGVDIHDDMEGWLSLIGYIPQSIFMLDDTIKANIAFGVASGDISEERLEKALEDSALDEFVNSLPEGINTQIGEKGVRLSGGQRQRIGIARALYVNPSVLVFDEATSSLDNETEQEIMNAIDELHGKKTMIIIAHRLTTIEGCDHVFRVENGKIVKER